MSDRRNIILITGRNAVGKTTASNYLRERCASSSLPCESKTISDALSLLKAMQKDDEQRGFHHTHDWCEATDYNEGHSHDLSQPMLPFTVLDNALPDAMLWDFFTELSNIPPADTLYIAEWAAGSNTNPENISASEIDYSYTKVKRMLQTDELPTCWLDRVRLVIHLVASDENRRMFNEKRYTPCLEEMLDGTVSWPLQNKILQFYGNDDFAEIEDIFQKMGIPVIEVVNDGDHSFFEEKLAHVISQLFALSPV